MLIVVAFLFGAGLYVTTQFNIRLEGRDTVYNETLAANVVSNQTATQLAHPTGEVTILFVTNATGAYDAHTETTQWDYNATGFYLIDAALNATAMNVTYSRDTYNSTAYMAIENVSEGTGDLATWIPIIMVIIAAAIIIGIVFRTFATRKVD